MDQNQVNEIGARVIQNGEKSEVDGRTVWKLEEGEVTWNAAREPDSPVCALYRNCTDRIGHFVPGRKYHYLYIGGGASQIFERSRHFVVESDYIWTIEKLASGKVVGVNKNATWELGYESNSWAHPARDAVKGLFTSFIPVPPDYAKENMARFLVAEGNG